MIVSKVGREEGIYETTKNAIIEGLPYEVIKKNTKLTDKQRYNKCLTVYIVTVLKCIVKTSFLNHFAEPPFLVL